MSATLRCYVDALTHSIPAAKPNANAITTNKYSRPPPNQAPKLVTISFQEKQQKHTDQKFAAQTAPSKTTQNKKRPASDANSMATEIAAEATIPIISDTTLADLKQEILNTVRQDLAKFAQKEVKPLRQDIKQLSAAHHTNR